MEKLGDSKNTNDSGWGGLEKMSDAAGNKHEESLAEAIYHAEEIRDLQKSFAKQLERHDGLERSEFERWEDDFAGEWRMMQDEIMQGNLGLEQVAEVEQHSVAYSRNEELNQTIEAQAGAFYRERNNELRQRIKDANGANMEEELKYLQDFYPTVLQHLDFKYMSADDVQLYGARRYDEDRTFAHNRALKRLNGINDLAKKYGTRPLTPRNFWPSDIKNERDQTPAMFEVMSYDRHILEEYYEIAFSSSVKQRKARLEREERLYGRIA